jgi:hypothetical protein
MSHSQWRSHGVNLLASHAPGPHQAGGFFVFQPPVSNKKTPARTPVRRILLVRPKASRFGLPAHNYCAEKGCGDFKECFQAPSMNDGVHERTIAATQVAAAKIAVARSRRRWSPGSENRDAMKIASRWKLPSVRDGS